MKITIEIDQNCIEDEVIIRCKEINESVSRMNKLIADASKKDRKLTLYKKEKEFYIEVSDILFFESDSDGVRAHTRDEMFTAKYKLYELENILPSEFCRISKSIIVNAVKIYAITRNITASSLVEFENTNKKVYTSRSYYKNLKNIMNEINQLVSKISSNKELQNIVKSKIIKSSEVEYDNNIPGNMDDVYVVVPKHEMFLDQENLNLVKWIEK